MNTPDVAEHACATAAWLAVLHERMRAGRLPIRSLGDGSAAAHEHADRERRSLAADEPEHASAIAASWDVPPRCAVVDRLLAQLCGGARDQPWEDEFWRCVLPGVTTLVPDALASTLLDRGVAVDALGHMPLCDTMLFRLMDEVVEALLTLANRRYVHDRFSVDQFEEVLHAGRESEWMLRSLITLEPSHAEKAERLAQHVAGYNPPLAWPKLVSQTFQRAWDAR
ncbi:MAG: hypothetical protein RIB58_10290 [Phycisphaerales bacterium]